jgi:membrane protease YdiL (CAAX protease family)
MKLRGLKFVVVILLALALVPVGAHLLALLNKIDLPQQDYFTVQAIYLGWALPAGIVLIGAILASLALTVLLRGRGWEFVLALVGFVLITATLVIFFVWTQPANQATANWTVAPVNWRTLRTQWEYSHAANAVLTFGAVCAAVASILVGHSERRSPLSARRGEPAGVD